MKQDKVNVFGIELKPADVTADVIGFGVGCCTTYMAEQIIDAALPTLSGPAYIAAQVGKWCAAGVIGDVVGGQTAEMIKTTNEIVDDISDKVLAAMGVS